MINFLEMFRMHNAKEFLRIMQRLLPINTRPTRIVKEGGGISRTLEKIKDFSVTKQQLEERAMELNKHVAALTPGQYKAYIKSFGTKI